MDRRGFLKGILAAVGGVLLPKATEAVLPEVEEAPPEPKARFGKCTTGKVSCLSQVDYPESLAAGLFGGTIYFVDAVNGGDSNDGLSPNRAWGPKFRKVNETEFSPGDVITLMPGMFRDKLDVSQDHIVISGNPDRIEGSIHANHEL